MTWRWRWPKRPTCTQLSLRLQDQNVPVVKMRQGVQTLGEASKELERLVYAGVMDHLGHPVLRWMASTGPMPCLAPATTASPPILATSPKP